MHEFDHAERLAGLVRQAEDRASGARSSSINIGKELLEALAASGLIDLMELQQETGIHRARLGRIRLGSRVAEPDEIARIVEATKLQLET